MLFYCHYGRIHGIFYEMFIKSLRKGDNLFIKSWTQWESNDTLSIYFLLKSFGHHTKLFLFLRAACLEREEKCQWLHTNLTWFFIIMKYVGKVKDYNWVGSRVNSELGQINATFILVSYMLSKRSQTNWEIFHLKYFTKYLLFSPDLGCLLSKSSHFYIGYYRSF